jgi:hypothetical protein
VSSRSYSDAQAAAIAAAVLDRGMSQKAARDAAANGELDGLEPFTLSLATTQRVVSRERNKRLQAEPFDVRSARLAKRALAVAEGEMTRIERLAKLTARDRAALDRLGRLAANLRAKPWRTRSADDVSNEDGNAIGLVERLARQHAEKTENGSATEKPGSPAAPTPPRPSAPSWVSASRRTPTHNPEGRAHRMLDDLERMRREAAQRSAPTAAEAGGALGQQREDA